MVKTSAPGKVHLIGEHTVVYGKPAILAAIGLRCFVDVQKNNSKWIKITNKSFNRETKFSVDEALKWADIMDDLWKECETKGDFSGLFKKLISDNYIHIDKIYAGKIMKELDIKDGFNATASTEIPLRSGLGSSSAYAVSFTKALSALFDMDSSLEEINRIAYELEKYNHGTPSGGDNSACCFGGLTWFQKAQPKPIIKSLREEIPQKLEGFVLVHVGEPEKTTGELVQMVKDLPDKKRNLVIEKIGKLTYEMRDVLKRKDYGRMKEIINETQDGLAELGVSTPKIDKVVEKVRSIRGAAKLCGAGAGGTVLCWHDNKEKLSNLIKDMGNEPIETNLAVEGVRVE